MIKTKLILSAALTSVLFLGCSEETKKFDNSAMLDNYGKIIGILADDFKTKSEALKSDFSLLENDFNQANAQDKWKEVASAYKMIQPILQTDKSDKDDIYRVSPDGGISAVYDYVDKWRMGQNNETYRNQAIDRTEWLLFTPWKVYGEDSDNNKNDYNTSEILPLGVSASNKLIKAAEAIKTHWSSAGELENIKSVDLASVEYISNRLFEYIGRLKDEHIGRAAALIVDANTKYPSKVESPSAGYSKEEALSLLKGIKYIYQGGNGLGLDDMLIDNGYSNYNDNMISAFDSVISRFEAIDGSLYDAITNDYENVEALYTSLQALEEAYYKNIITLMSVTPDMPFTNDGDTNF